MRIIRVFKMRGSVYSRNKDYIKEIIKKRGLSWKGTLEFPKWKSKTETLTAIFERENDITVSVTLSLHADDNSDTMKELTAALVGFGAEYSDEVVKSDNEDIEKEIARRMEIWDKINRPCIENLRRGNIFNNNRPIPEAFVKAALDDYEKRREREIERLRRKLSNMNDDTEMHEETKPEAVENISKDELVEPLKKYKEPEIIELRIGSLKRNNADNTDNKV